MDLSDRILIEERSLRSIPKPPTPTSVGGFRHLGDHMGKPVTAAMAVQCVELLQLPTVNPATIRKWAERGRVKRYGLDQYGLQKYELGDIIRMVSSGDQPVDQA